MVPSIHTRTALSAALVLAATPIAAFIVASPPAIAMGKIRCDVGGPPTVAVGAIDPIVNHNQASASHQHQFFGAKDWLVDLKNPNTANWTDLAGHQTNCRAPADTAGYWTPTLRYKSGTPNAGQLVPVQQFTAYYRPFTGLGTQIGPGIAYPRDTRLVSSPGRYAWNCGENSGERATRVPSIPDCTGLSGKPGYTLSAHIEFPSCWDGVLPDHKATDVGNTSDDSHYAYPVDKLCPPAFPVETVQLQQTLQFAYVGPGDDVTLSSDHHNGVSDGRSLHADFFNAWNQKAFRSHVKNCVNAGGVFTDKECQP